MKAKWRTSPLEDVLDAIIDYRGKTPKKTISGIPLVTAKIVKDGAVQSYTEFISEEDYEGWMTRGMPEVGDIVLTTEAPLGEVAQIVDSNIALAQRIVTLRGKKGILHNGYLKYFLLSENGQNRLKARESGTTVLGIKQSELRLVEIDYPDYQIQEYIAHILGSLDDKIECNRRMNETLEAMAQALFKSWFVDFDPVIDNTLASGNEIPDELQERAARRKGLGKKRKPLPKEIQKLFPAKFELTEEMGWIPEGWEVSCIGKEADCVGGGTPSTKEDEYWRNGNIYWTTPKDLSNKVSKILLKTERKITDKGLSVISSGLLPINTVLLSSRAPVGYLALAKVPLAINQGYIAMICKHRLSPEYIIQWAESAMSEIQGRASGTTFAEISKANFRLIPIVVPKKEEIILAYTKIVSCFYDSITSNLMDNELLEASRDLLLPRLISGELRVSIIQFFGELCVNTNIYRMNFSEYAIADSEKASHLLEQKNRLEDAFIAQDTALVLDMSKAFLETIFKTILTDRCASPDLEKDFEPLYRDVRCQLIYNRNEKANKNLELICSAIVHNIRELRNEFGAASHGDDAYYDNPIEMPDVELIISVVDGLSSFLYKKHRASISPENSSRIYYEDHQEFNDWLDIQYDSYKLPLDADRYFEVLSSRMIYDNDVNLYREMLVQYLSSEKENED